MSAASSRPKLSVVMIARDAASQIERSLESVRNIADEMIVLDTGSKDGTSSIASACGASLVRGDWNDDFAAARNEAASQASGDWLLWLDAGECISAADAQKLREFVNLEASPMRAYAMLVVVPPAPGTIAGEQAARIRLVPNHPELRYEGRIREQLQHSLAAASIEVDGLPMAILRTAHEHEPAVKRAKAERDMRIAAKAIAEEGPLPRLQLTLATALASLGRYEDAAQLFRHAIQQSPSGSAEQREAYYGLLAIFDNAPEGRPAQLAVCLKALEAYPVDAQLLCALGGYLQSQGQADLAARAYETAVQFGQVDPTVWHVPEIAEIAAICLALVHGQLGRGDAALVVLEDACERLPQSSRLRRMLMDSLIDQDHRQAALALADRMADDLPSREALRSAVRGACLAAKKDWAAALAFLKTAYAAGCRDLLCLRALAQVFIEVGHFEEARGVLAQWRLLEPHSAALREALITVGMEPIANEVGQTIRMDGASGPMVVLAPHRAPAANFAARD